MTSFPNRTKQLIIANFIPVVTSMALILLFTRLYEWGLLLTNHGSEIFTLTYLLSGICYDILFASILALPASYIYHALKSSKFKISIGGISTLIVFIGLLNIIFITYFNATLIPLGAEFLAYSVSEMADTIAASNRITIGLIFLITVFCIILYWIATQLIQISYSKFPKKLILGLFAITILCSGAYLYLKKTDNTSRYAYNQNKLAYLLNQSLQSKFFTSLSSTQKISINQAFPFLHSPGSTDKLGPFFRNTSKPPNIVFIVVESLGGEFIGPSGQWTGFAPYLDSLSQQSLYWENGLSLSGRTFGIIPSLTGSLPPVENGFMSLGPDYPNHLTLINMLDERGYQTAFYSGYDTYFDNLDYFLDFNSIDFILNKQKLDKIYSNQNSDSKDRQNYWGYDDKTMFSVASQILDTTSAFPRLEIYHTLQSHSPFTVPNPEKYRQKFENRLEELDLSDSQKERFRRYRRELTSLLFTDDALRDFMNEYRKKEEFEHTIFVITGDHWLIPIPQTSEISRYHVPIVIYSPLLKKPVHFNSINTHANIAPSITNYLDHNTGLSMPLEVPWIGQPLDTVRKFRNIHSIPLMKNKKQLTDYISGKYYLQGNQLFKMQDSLLLANIDNPVEKNRIQNKLETYKARSSYAVNRDKLYPDSISTAISQKYTYISQFDTLFQRIDSLELNPDAQFQLARKKAFEGHYKQARAICKRLLMRYPDYHDARLLLGRTYAWEGDYKEARKLFTMVKKKDPQYYDTYMALADLERWSGDLKKALSIINEGLQYHPDLKPLLEKKIRILGELEQISEARRVYQKMKELYSAQGNILEFEKYL